jgi:hypothetical protein
MPEHLSRGSMAPPDRGHVPRSLQERLLSDPFVRFMLFAVALIILVLSAPSVLHAWSRMPLGNRGEWVAALGTIVLGLFAFGAARQSVVVARRAADITERGALINRHSFVQTLRRDASTLTWRMADRTWDDTRASDQSLTHFDDDEHHAVYGGWRTAAKEGDPPSGFVVLEVVNAGDAFVGNVQVMVSESCDEFERGLRPLGNLSPGTYRILISAGDIGSTPAMGTAAAALMRNNAFVTFVEFNASHSGHRWRRYGDGRLTLVEELAG